MNCIMCSYVYNIYIYYIYYVHVWLLQNFRCTYLLKGNEGDRIRLYFRDFDVYFGGEHCPYDAVSVYDGPDTRSPIIRKLCGLQQRMELFSQGSQLLLEFNTSAPAKNDPRGFLVEYAFSDLFVDVRQLVAGQKGVSYLTGSECDVRVQSHRESTHYIQSPNVSLFVLLLLAHMTTMS